MASGGTLGILIPPSVAMVIYAILTETSVGQLFLAGLIPGIIAIVLYATTVAIWTRLNPELAGQPQKPLLFVQRVLDQRHMLGMLTLFKVVVGGIFSPTEGAAIGVGMARMVPDLDLWTAFRGVAPFVVTDLLRLALIVSIPAISLWLPDLAYGGLL